MTTKTGIHPMRHHTSTTIQTSSIATFRDCVAAFPSLMHRLACSLEPDLPFSTRVTPHRTPRQRRFSDSLSLVRDNLFR